MAREPKGPRGDSSLRPTARDEPGNLILLCRNHHKEIDDQPKAFSVEALKDIKANHEAWVRASLEGKSRTSHTPFFALRIDSGNQILGSIVGCDAFHLHNEQPRTMEEAVLIGDFAQSLQDYGDLWSDLEGKDRVLAQFELDRQIQELKQNGLLLYAAERKQRFVSPSIGKSMDWMVIYVFVVSKASSLVRRKDETIESLMQSNEQRESGFTNFIPVMSGPSSVRLV